MKVTATPYQAIRTRFLGPTNTKGSRIVADCAARRRVYTYESNLSTFDNHEQACLMLATELDWQGDWIGGTIKDGSMVWVLMDN